MANTFMRRGTLKHLGPVKLTKGQGLVVDLTSAETKPEPEPLPPTHSAEYPPHSA